MVHLNSSRVLLKGPCSSSQRNRLSTAFYTRFYCSDSIFLKYSLACHVQYYFPLPCSFSETSGCTWMGCELMFGWRKRGRYGSWTRYQNILCWIRDQWLQPWCKVWDLGCSEKFTLLLYVTQTTKKKKKNPKPLAHQWLIKKCHYKDIQ